MRFGGFQYAFLALALSACANSKAPNSGFDTVTVQVPPPTASQLGSTAPASVPQPAQKPAQAAVAKEHQAKAKAPRQAQQPPREARPAPTHGAKVTATLTPEDVAPRAEAEAAPKAQTTTQTTTPEPTRPATVENAQGRTNFTPRMPNLRQLANCKDATKAVCKGFANCAWIDTHTVGPGASVDGHCESK